jgi:hypothetical protein
MPLTLVPCNHYWLEVRGTAFEITAVCKHFHCRKTGRFTVEQWDALAEEGQALNKPVRV